jgi:nucleoside 2-deoxyribosyltransferase
VYLAGPITGVSYDAATEWREYARQKLAPDIETFSPLRGKDYLVGVNAIEEKLVANHTRSTDRAITTTSRFDATSRDLMLVNLLGAKTVTIGTMVEMGWADEAGKPVVLVMEPGNIHDNAIVRGLPGYITSSLDDALNTVRGVLLSRGK